MVQIRHDCPHCGTRRAGFDYQSEYRNPVTPLEIHAFFKCGICDRAVVGQYYGLGRHVDAAGLTFASHGAAHPDEFIEVAFYPPPETPEAPEHMPKNVLAYYLEAVANVKTGPNAAGAMFRKSLDVGLRYIDGGAKGLLVKRIDNATKAGKLTPELAEWAHQIRLEGNDATHDEDPYTQEEAADLHSFCELVMQYLFTLPGILKEMRDKPEAAGEAEAG